MLNLYGANPNKRIGRTSMAPGLWNTPLNVAAATGNTRVVEMLLAHGADPAYGQADGACQALGVAARYGHEDIVSILLQNKRIALNARLRNGATVLGLAVSSGKTSMVQMMLDNEGIDPNATMGNGKTPLMIAAQGPYGRNGLAMTKLLLSDERVDTSLRDNSGANSLHLAARNDQTDVVDMFLKQGTFDPNEADAQGDTPVAGVGACEESLLAFINDATVDLNLVGRTGFTLLMENVFFLRANNVEQLLASGRVNVNQTDNSGDTALMLACNCWVDSIDCCRIMQALLEAPGINVDAANRKGETALLFAVRSGAKDIVAMLLETGEAQVTLAVLQEASPGMLDVLYTGTT
ncbi:ankyrin repeat-containing domain protein, partial [Trichoderma austrokoningii]